MIKGLVESLLHQVRAATLSTLCLVGIANAQENEVPVVPNFEIMRLLGERVADAVGKQIGEGDSIQLLILPQDRSWYLESSIVRGFLNRGFPSSESSSARFHAEFGQKMLRVVYGDIQRDGFLGRKVVSRTVQVTLSAKVVDRHTGIILVTRDFADEATDTIGLSQILEVENPNIPVTRGALPPEGFFTNLVEPLVVIGSIAVAVYLLFHVRS
ncbi:MAG TPA: hypothetical protein VFG32_02405 [Bacteroidota bacterium]|nr:hypothetical protein [Bacteroidota bacterium]